MNQRELMEQFAIHAPHPPSWFQPVFRPRPVVWNTNIYNCFYDEKLTILREQWDDEDRKWIEDNKPVPDEFKKEVAEFIKARDIRYDEWKRWPAEFAQEKLIQWVRWYSRTMAGTVHSFNGDRAKHAIIHFRNDPSVGMFSETYTMDIPILDELDREKTREDIKVMYETMHGESAAQVWFSDERID